MLVMGIRQGDAGEGQLLIAAALGTVHAGFSAHWALGGTTLLDTVGETAGRFDGGALATVMLALVIAVKAAVAWGPWLTRRWIGFAGAIGRRLATFAGLVLAIYGTVLTVVGLVALTGLLGQPSDPVSLAGHALLWDPLFALWGLFLLRGLRRSQPRRPGRGQASEAGREREVLVSAR